MKKNAMKNTMMIKKKKKAFKTNIFAVHRLNCNLIDIKLCTKIGLSGVCYYEVSWLVFSKAYVSL